MKNFLKKNLKLIIIIFSIVIMAAGTLIVLKLMPLKEYKVCFKDNETTYAEYSSKDKISKPKDPQKEGYDFKGWYLNGKLYDFSEKLSSNITLEAKWEIKKLNVSFNEEDGSKINEEVVEYGNKVEKPENPQKEDYDFKGWYLNDQEYDFDTTVIENIILIAKWEKKVEQIPSNTQSTQKNTNSNINTNTNSTTTNDNYEYDRSNPKVAAVLNMIGRTNVPCTLVVQAAFESVGKSFWGRKTEETNSYYSIFGNFIGEGDAGIQAGETLTTEGTWKYCVDNTEESCVSRTDDNYLLVKITNGVISSIQHYSCDPADPTNCRYDDQTTGYVRGQVYNIGDKGYWKGYRVSPVMLTPSNIFLYGTEKDISLAEPGDVIYYDSGGRGEAHVAIYIGNGKAVHGGMNDNMEVKIATIYLSGASAPRAFSY